MTDYDRAMRDPKSCFGEPNDVLLDDSLSKDEKINILKQWEYDARELSVAEEENMRSNSEDEATMLNRIRLALASLGIHQTGSSGGKQ